MENWLYTVWFEDSSLDSDEENYEWCAWIIIEANAQEDAKEWGDKLSNEYISANEANKLIKSDVEKFIRETYTDISDLPFIKYGHLASDEEIGW